MEAAITRERRLKKWNRAWKVRLIEEANPSWRDLYSEITLRAAHHRSPWRQGTPTVVPVETGTHPPWIPACAGMTGWWYAGGFPPSRE